MMGNYGMGHEMGFMGMSFFILFWLLIIVGIVFLVKWIIAQTKSTDGASETPLDILKKRYARGEINKEEFEEKKRDLI
jgi:putative membrane protein